MTHPFLFFQWLADKLHFAEVFGFHHAEKINHVTYTWFVMLILVVLAFLAARSIKTIPGGLQNLMEVIVTGIEGLIVETMGEEGKKYFPLIALALAVAATGDLLLERIVTVMFILV